jgi:hypothetical protein
VDALLDAPTSSNLPTTTYGSQTTELASFLLDADAGDVLVLGNSGCTVVDVPAGGNLSSRDCVQMTYQPRSGLARSYSHPLVFTMSVI